MGQRVGAGLEGPSVRKLSPAPPLSMRRLPPPMSLWVTGQHQVPPAFPSHAKPHWLTHPPTHQRSGCPEGSASSPGHRHRCSPPGGGCSALGHTPGGSARTQHGQPLWGSRASVPSLIPPPARSPPSPGQCPPLHRPDANGPGGSVGRCQEGWCSCQVVGGGLQGTAGEAESWLEGGSPPARPCGTAGRLVLGPAVSPELPMQPRGEQRSSPTPEPAGLPLSWGSSPSPQQQPDEGSCRWGPSPTFSVGLLLCLHASSGRARTAPLPRDSRPAGAAVVRGAWLQTLPGGSLAGGQQAPGAGPGPGIGCQSAGRRPSSGSRAQQGSSP